MVQTKHEQVSFDDEKLILVNEEDDVLGYEKKDVCHLDNGILHRAFSIFIFNSEGKVLMQKRSAQKKLWPLYWSNSCCSHPRQGESYEIATSRRLLEELGLKANLVFLFKFQYQAKFDDVGSEHELCSVYIGKTDDSIQANKNEISEWEFIDPQELDRRVEKYSGDYTPWFKMEWERIRNEYWERVIAL